MTKAYLQNKKAAYYYLTSDGQVSLTTGKTALQSAPDIMDHPDALSATSNRPFPQTAFVFRNDGCRIISWLFFTKGTAADCILTLEPEDAGCCGDLDFTTARIYGNKEIRICCNHF